MSNEVDELIKELEQDLRSFEEVQRIFRASTGTATLHNANKTNSGVKKMTRIINALKSKIEPSN